MARWEMRMGAPVQPADVERDQGVERGARAGGPPHREAPASASAPAPAPSPGQRFGALRHRDFALLWGGLLLSNTGTWMQGTAQGYLVYELTSSPLATPIQSSAGTRRTTRRQVIWTIPFTRASSA